MKKFKTESKKLLDLMINSIYTNREIFLRELISNASDAVDKLYFKSLTDSDIQLDKDALAIRVDFDRDARTVTISDCGIGMTKAELEENLGTIAHSGSLEFKKENAEAQGDDVDIIGQFGVGFYSGFMVAKEVKVVSRAFGTDEAYCWVSDGVEGYTISEAERATHGTDVILTLKDNTDEESYDTFLSEWGLKGLIRKYSNYVRYPIQMECDRSREVPRPEDAGDDYQPQYENYKELETVNSMIPIWKRKKSDVSQEEYDEFYKSDFHDYAAPARTVSVHAEGTLSYDALLFVPSRAPYGFYSKDYQKGLALYSSNVLIMEKCEELIPDYFNFVRGVVDSQDLTLNISRETLQHNNQLRVIAKKIEKKIKADLANMLEKDRAEYEIFFENFGRALKYGIYETYGQAKDTLSDLLLFYSVKEQKMVTLTEYVEHMPADQKSIFYAVGDSTDRLAKLPIVSFVQNKGYDVLLCADPVDEFCFQGMQNFGLKDAEADAIYEFKNVAGGDLGLETEEEKAAADEAAKTYEGLFEAMKDALDGKVVKVAVSARLSDTPACITAEGPISLEMEKILSTMPDAEADELRTSRVLEMNVEHPVFAQLNEAFTAGDMDKVKLYTDVLYNQALLVEGLSVEDPVAFAQNICSLMM